MSDERLQILKMVQEGKLSAEEATRLLDAVEAGRKTGKGPKATHIRVHFAEGKKVTNFSVGVGLAQWVLSLPLGGRLRVGERQVDTDQLLQVIESGATGKVMEITEDEKRLEIWLDP